MFFADPVASFANLRKGLARGGRVVFACWREAKRNPWQMIALKAACKHVPRLPEVGPEDPGPFSFADEARVRRILGEAGFETIALTPVDLELDVAAGQGLEAALATLQQIGAASRALEGQPEALRAAAVAEIRAALAPHQRGLACRSAPRSGSSKRSIPDRRPRGGGALSILRRQPSIRQARRDR